MLNIYLQINFDVLHAATDNGYPNGKKIRLVSLCPFGFFSTYILTNSSGKHLEEISHAHIVFLLYKLLKFSRGSDDLSIGFDRDRNRRLRELTNI